MAAKARGKSRSSGAKRALEQLQAENRRVVDARYRLLHPRRAAEERALRKAQAERQRDFGHKRNGTVETHAQAAQVRQGALARLYQSGAISIEQLGSALEIAAEVERIGADVSVKTASLETRIDISRSGHDMFFESLGRVRRAVAYSRWRAELPRVSEGMGAAPVLAMIVDDIGIVEAARQFGIHRRRAKRVLIAAVDLWPQVLGEAIRDVDAEDLAILERRLG